MKSVAILITLLAFAIRQEVSGYIETPLDQIAEEARQSDHSIRVRAPTSLLGDRNPGLKSLTTKYGDRTKQKKYIFSTSHMTKIRNKPPKTLIQTPSNDRHKERFHSPLYRQQPDQYRVTTASIQVIPDNNDSNDGYYGWMPIVPKFLPDNSGKPKQQTSETRQNIPTPPSPRRQSPKATNGRHLTLHPKSTALYKRRRVNKVALKRKTSSVFSGAAGSETVKHVPKKELDASESHHVEYKTKIKHHHHHHHHKYVQKVVEKVPVKVPVKVYVPKPYPVEKKVPYPVEKIVHKIVEKKVPYPVEKKVPYPVEVKVPQPYPVKVIEKEYIPKPYPVVKHVQVVKKVEVKVPVPKPVPYPVEKKVPYPVEVKVPYPVEKKVPYPVEVEKKVPFPVKVYVPKPFPVEKKVPYPVEVKVKEPYPVYQPVHVPVKIYVDKPYPVPVPKPYPVEVEKRVPYPVEVEKKVPIPVRIYVPKPYPVEKPYPVYINKESHHNPQPIYGVSGTS